MDEDQEVTALLRELSGSDEQSLGDVIPLVYGQLRAIAARQMAHEPAGHTLNPTAVVHEAFLRLQEINEIEWKSRGHFYAIASQAMRRVLVNYAVRRNTEKRGGRRRQVQLTDRLGLATEDADGVLAVHQALERLEKLDARQVRVVECRFFSGLSIEETAEALGVSVATVKRDWAMARAWLNRALKDE